MSSGSHNGEERLVGEVPNFIENQEDENSKSKLKAFLGELEKTIERHMSRLFVRFSLPDTFLRPLWNYIMHYCRMIFRIIKTQIVTFVNNILSSKSAKSAPEKPAGNQDTSSIFAMALDSMRLVATEEIIEEPLHVDEHVHELETHLAEVLQDLNRYGSVPPVDLEKVQNPTRFEMLLMRERNVNRASGSSTSSGSVPGESNEEAITSPNPGSVQDLDNGFDSLEREQWELRRNQEETRIRQEAELEAMRQQRIANQTRAVNERVLIQRRINRTISRNS